MEDTINRIPEVYSIFVNFFGEEYVDLQDSNDNIRKDIIIHFPKVRVTNEHDRSIDITHLWAKVTVTTKGLIEALKMMRSEYTETQFLSGYVHSHLSHVDRYSYNEWKSPCLGSGPIRDTYTYLCTDYYLYSEDMWNLFCLELSKYVTVESIKGRPYKYLEQVGKRDMGRAVKLVPKIKNTIEDLPITKKEVARFIPFVISKRPFKFNFKNGAYGIALSNINKVLILSNLYIEFYNSLPIGERIPKEDLFNYKFINYAKKIDGKFYYMQDNFTSRLSECSNLIGEELFTFKGNSVTLNITKDEDILENTSIVLSNEIVEEIINRILIVVNTKFLRVKNHIKYGELEHPNFLEKGYRHL